MNDEITIDQAGASTLAGRAEDFLEGSATETLPSAGDPIGRYVVLEHLGTGGMGVVFAAYDPELDRKVAVKLLRVTEGGSSSSEGGGARLLDEARALARLSHPNVIAVHDVGVHQKRIFVAMEFVDGQTLSAWQGAATRGPQELCRAYVAAGEGLAAAHRAGLVHRDFKPDNVMIDADGRIRVLDFGLARAARRGLTASELGDLRVDDPRTRGLVGTPAYMAPEQFGGGSVDARTDQFSFCVSLWEALYGERPFRGDTVTALAFATLHEDPVPPAGNAVDPRIGQALIRGLAKDPEQRFETMDALLRELRPAPVSGRAWWRLGGAALAGGAIAAVVAATWPGPSDAIDRCADRADVSEVWSADTRQALRDALGSAAGSRAVATMESSLDAYATSLSTRLRRACEAEILGDTEHDLARTARCLDRRRSALEHAVSLLVSTPERARVRGPEIVGALPPIVDCDSPEGDDLDGETDSARIEIVDALESRLDDAEIRIIGGQLEEPRAVLDEVLTQARAQSLHGVEARARFLDSNLQSISGAEGEARKARVDAFAGALRAGRHTLALSAAASLVHHDAFIAADLPSAEDWLRIARALEARVSPSREQRVAMANAVGTLAFAKADYAGALTAYTEAATLCAEITEKPAGCIRELLDISQTLSKLGRNEEAIEHIERAISVHVAAQGEAHPQTAVLLTNYSAMLAGLGRTEEALEQARHALALAEAFWGSDNAEVIPFLGNASDALAAVGRLDEAGTLLDRAVAILERHDPIDRHMMSYARHSRGALAQSRGQWRAAADDFLRSADLREALFGPEHPLVLEPRFRAADALFTAGDAQAALDLAEGLVGECPEAGCGASDLLARALRVEAMVALGRAPEAREALDELVAARDRSREDDERALARVRVAELALAETTAEERRRLRATLLEHEGPASPAAARLDARSGAPQGAAE
jgi:tetratricopeptide (TPR) repeat protein